MKTLNITYFLELAIQMIPKLQSCMLKNFWADLWERREMPQNYILEEEESCWDIVGSKKYHIQALNLSPTFDYWVCDTFLSDLKL